MFFELELCAVWWAAEKCDYYLRGIHEFKVITDHRPLVGLFKKPLASITNGRLQRLREKLNHYNFDCIWVAGKTHLIADALSRTPLFPADPELDASLREELCAAILTDDPIFASLRDSIDDDYKELREHVRQGRKFPQRVSPFHQVRVRVEEDLLLVGDRLVVPRPARQRIIALIHGSHSGCTKSLELARQTYFWPGMIHEIKQFIAWCPECVSMLPSQAHEPILSAASTAEYPMQAVSTDLFDCLGKTYVIMVDRYSGFPFISRLSSTTTEAVWSKLMGWFQDFGMPGLIKSDGGPQYRQQFSTLCAENNIIHEQSAPYHPESNGLAEAAVKLVKALLKKTGGVDNTVFRSALLEWRNTPRASGFSPAAGFFGRWLRTRLPSAEPLHLDTTLQAGFESARLDVDAARVEAAGGHKLPPLQVGDRVHIQNYRDKAWSFDAGVVTTCFNSGRSYEVATSGGTFRRNRIHLRPAPTYGPVPPVETGVPAVPLPAPILRRSARLGAKLAVSFGDGTKSG
ncbi:uncharacterized protein K02A2.6-like [Tigriopus californicus]|uniref:uncharacterized protein K02A2.6-like n=1 Tax=Tigriopus californicus TaxID=6832 RepID=UPI0027D9E966|nr:uncharacterized protein K02A2.6-like [Tigriopus californicus]